MAYFRVVSDLQKNYKGSTESFHRPQTQFLLLTTSNTEMVNLLQLRSPHWYFTTQQNPCFVEISLALLLLYYYYYSWFTILCQFLLHSKVTESYVYIHNFFFFWLSPQHAEVPGPRSNPCHSSDSHCCSDARSLTCCATKEFPIHSFFNIIFHHGLS